MSKLTKEQKIEIYEKRKNFETIPCLAKQYRISEANIKYLIRLIDYHGYEILRDGKNQTYSIDFKTEFVKKVLINHESVKSVAIQAGLSSDSIIRRWIINYKSNNCVIVEKKKGKQPTMTKKAENMKSCICMNDKNRIQYLEAENEYLKKLAAVIQMRKNQRLKI